jgi:molybdopterin-guanine dinucleotide biosynthesis protein A
MLEPALTVLILAGGASSRMGSDKAWLLVDGQPLVERLAWRVLPLAGEIIFSTQQPERYTYLIDGLPVPAQAVADAYPGSGPLAGLHAGLSAASQELTLALATDMPLVNLALLSHMAGLANGYDVVMPRLPVMDRESGAQPRYQDRSELGLEPLHAIYRRSCLPAVEARLAAGQRRLVSFLPDVRVRDVWPEEIADYDPQFLSFLNLNTPGEWERARAWLANH